MSARRQPGYPDRIRGWLDSHGVTQQQLAVEVDTEPATICRNIAECDPYVMWQYGIAFGQLTTRNNTRQGRGRTQRA